MNPTRRSLSVLALAMCAVAGLAHAADPNSGTKDEAKALVDAAVEHVKKVGPDQAFKDFFADKATWTKKDLFVIAFDSKGVCRTSAFEKLHGKAMMDVKDDDGKLFVKEMVDVAMTKGSGWVDYTWPHPITKKLAQKSSYVRKPPNFDGFVGVGVYP